MGARAVVAMRAALGTLSGYCPPTGAPGRVLERAPGALVAAAMSGNSVGFAVFLGDPVELSVDAELFRLWLRGLEGWRARPRGALQAQPKEAWLCV